MERRSPRQRKLSASTPSRPNYYAGARFETIPTLSSLPAPPMRWTMSSPLPRSQSMPSSPITTKMMGPGSGEILQGMTSGSTIFKSASFPGDSSLLSLFRVRDSSNVQEELQQVKRAMRPLSSSSSPVQVVEEKVDLIQMLIQASPKREQQQQEQQQYQKKRDISPPKLIPRSIAKPCHLYNNDQEYKDISKHLKSLLKVSA